MTDDTCGAATERDGSPCQLPASEPDGRCWNHTSGDQRIGGRPSKFDDHWEGVLEAAHEPIKTRDVARTAGVGKSTLYDWLDEDHTVTYQGEDCQFSDAFKRARSAAARELVERGLNDPDVDTSMVRFLLERTFDYIKTQEVEHTGDGLTINLPDEVAEY